MKESDFTKAVHKRLPPNLWAWKICDPYMGGIPDAYYRNNDNGGAVWVEYKYLKTLPKRADTRIIPNLSKLQLQMLTDIVNAKQQALVIVGYGSQGVVLGCPQQWVEGITVHDFTERLLSYNALGEVILSYTLH